MIITFILEARKRVVQGFGISLRVAQTVTGKARIETRPSGT